MKKKYDKTFKKEGLKESFSNISVNQNLPTPNGTSKNVDEEFKPLTKDKSSIFDATTIEANDNISNDTRIGDFIEPDIEKGSEKLIESPKKSTGTTSEEEMEQSQALSLLIFFVVYTFVGAALLSAYEPDMTFFKAIYFNFVSLSSIGMNFGDFLNSTCLFFRIRRYLSKIRNLYGIYHSLYCNWFSINHHCN